MIKRRKLLCVLLVVIASCKEVYNPNVKSPVTGFLVVEGFINSVGETNIRLSRTTKLSDAPQIVYEFNALVTIEGENNESYSLIGLDSGRYRSDYLNLNSNAKYRLHIQTADGGNYLSDFSKVRYTPPIDSVSWLRDNEGVHIYVNAHDDAKSTRYYQWEFAETWEFHSFYNSQLQWVRDESNKLIGVIDRASQVYQCWHTINSSNILIGSTEKLSADKIYLQLHEIEPASVKLSVLYSIIIRQHALSHEAYIFYEKMKKNTEQVGSIFDAQPSELQGNIHNSNNTAETVVGFVEVSTEEAKRIFISREEVPGWGYVQSCSGTEIDNKVDSIQKYGPGLEPVMCISGCPFITRFSAAPGECVDCTLRGTTVRPDFWP